MGNTNPNRAYRAFVLIVLASGAILALVLCINGNLESIRSDPVPFVFLTGLIILSELREVEVPRRIGEQAEAQTLTEVFAFTLMLGWGLGPSVLATSFGVLIGQALLRRQAVKVLFNSAQHGLSLFAAGSVYYLLGGYEGSFSIEKLLPFFIAAYVYHIINFYFVETIIALHEHVPLSSVISIVVPRWFEFLMVGMAPIMLIIFHTNGAFAPLLLLPVLAIYLAMRSAKEANLRKAEAEAAAERYRKLVELEQEVVRRLKENDRLREEFISAIGEEIWTPLIQDSMDRGNDSELENESSGRKRQTDSLERTDHSSQRPEPTRRSKVSAEDPRNKKLPLSKTVTALLGITIVVTIPIVTGSVRGEIGRNLVISAILVALSTFFLLTLSYLVRLITRSRTTKPLEEDLHRHVQVLRYAYSLESQILADLRVGGRSTDAPYPMYSTNPGTESFSTVDPTTRPRD
jgi:hypothetical protein